MMVPISGVSFAGTQLRGEGWRRSFERRSKPLQRSDLNKCSVSHCMRIALLHNRKLRNCKEKPAGGGAYVSQVLIRVVMMSLQLR